MEEIIITKDYQSQYNDGNFKIILSNWAGNVYSENLSMKVWKDSGTFSLFSLFICWRQGATSWG